jgi:peroxiredoxin
MRKALLLSLFFLTVPFLAGCQVNQPAHAADAAVATGWQVGNRAPDFNLLAVGEGRSIRLQDLQGKPVLLNFYCGCTFCGTVAHEWVKNRDKAGDAVVLAVMTNHWTYGPAAVRDFRKRTGWSWPTLADLGSQTAKEYNALTCPRLFAIDSQGIIRYTNAPGDSDEKQLVAAALAAVRGR